MLVRNGDGYIRSVSVPMWLVDLLNYRAPRIRIKPRSEDDMCIDFANRLRAAAIEGRLKGTFTHIPHEIGGAGKLAMMRLALAKALGMIPGSGDYVFVWPGGGGWIEAKTASGSLNANQRAFRDWCALTDTPYEVMKSADQGEEILRRWGVLS